MTTQTIDTPGLGYDASEGAPIPILKVSDNEAVAVLRVGHLLQLVPSPVASEQLKRRPEVAMLDPRLAPYSELRAEVQRAFEGAKKRNAARYSAYLCAGVRNERLTMTPAITLFHQELLGEVRLGGDQRALLFPHGDFFVAIDGETQCIALEMASRDCPAILEQRVPVLIHHGISRDHARQGFYDLNTKEVKPTASVAISMDSTDPATAITRKLMGASPILRDRVNLRRRQLRKLDRELLTISALRTGVVTTMLGAPGLQVGSRSVELPEDIDVDSLEDRIVDVWLAVIEDLEEALDPDGRENSVASSPAVLAGIGILAHHAMPAAVRREEVDEWTVKQVRDALEGVSWAKSVTVDGHEFHPWDGVAGKVTTSVLKSGEERTRFSIGGPKEVGYSVTAALEDMNAASGRRIRGSDGP